MKKRNLGQVLTILFISGMMTTAGTLAWFQTVRNAEISFKNASVHSASSDLLVDFKSSLNTFTSNVKDTNDNSITLGGSLKVTDVSGDGINLYKPLWSATNDIAQEILEVATTGAPGVANGYYIDFTITVSRLASAGEGVKVYLGAGTGIFPKNPLVTKDVEIVKATRLAVINYDDFDSTTGTPEVVFLHAPVEEPSPTYLVEGTGAYGTTTHAFAAGVTLKSNAFITASTIAASEVAYPAIANLMSESSVDVTFRVWVEGTDLDAKNDNISGAFGIVLNLYSVAQ